MLEPERTVEVENPAEALRDESGIFQVTSPFGQVFQVTCRKGSNMRIREIGALDNTAVAHSKRWRIQKLMRPLACD
jgi:hypothetical protein